MKIEPDSTGIIRGALVAIGSIAIASAFINALVQLTAVYNPFVG